MSFLNKIMISCKQATYLYEKKKEGKLDAPERFGLWVHLLYCRFCRLFIRQVEQIESAAHKFYQNTERFRLPGDKKVALQKAFDEELKK